MKKIASLIIPFCCWSFLATAQTDTTKRYTKTPSGYLMVLRQGDDILKKLEEFAIAEKIPSANFTGMGFVNIQFGFFDAFTKKYIQKILTTWKWRACMEVLRGRMEKYRYIHMA